jgi:hypothetical protein
VKLGNVVIIGDPSYPLTFRFTQTGYQYLYGRGRLKVGPTREYLLGEKDSVDNWTSRAQSPEDWIREGAAAALGFLPKDDSEKQAALSSLVILAKDRSATVRRNAAESLGRLKNASTLPLLEQMSTGDKDEWVKRVASWAKAQTSTPEKETYEEVNPAELPFAFKSKSKGISFEGGVYRVTGGKVTEFSLVGKKIPLQTDDITEEGYVLTKDFGQIKLTFSSTMKVTIWLTPSQEQAFKQFAG